MVLKVIILFGLVIRYQCIKFTDYEDHKSYAINDDDEDYYDNKLTRGNFEVDEREYATQKLDALQKRSNNIIALRGYKDACLFGMDKIRSAFGDQNLQWDTSLAVEAEQWAIHLARLGYVTHSSTTNGENLWFEVYTNAQTGLYSIGQKVSCANPLYGWYNERAIPNKEVGHLTQMIAERVNRFGIGVAYNTKIKTIFFVGRFDVAMHSGDSALELWNSYLRHKERWVIPNLGRLVTDKGQLVEYPQ